MVAENKAEIRIFVYSAKELECYSLAIVEDYVKQVILYGQIYILEKYLWQNLGGQVSCV